MKKTFAVIAAVGALSGCATRPEQIAALDVPHDTYMGSDCAQLATKMSGARADLQKFSAMQESKANVDRATMMFLLIPASKLTGDHAAEVAKSKGELAAIETAQARKGCNAAKA